MSALSGGVWTQGVCPAIQTQLINITGGPADPQGKGWHTGVLDYFMTQRAGGSFIQSQVDAGDGKGNEGTNRSKTVDYVYYQRANPDDASTSVSTGCPTGNQKPLCEGSFDVQNELESEILRVQDDQMRRICQDTRDTHIAKQLQMIMRATEKRLNDLIATDLTTNIGQFEDGAASNSYRVINNTTGGVWSLGEANMRRDLMDSHFSGPVSVIGAGNWAIYKDITDIGGLQDTGVLTQRLGRFGIYYDPDLSTNASLGSADSGLVIENGVAHLATWNGFRGDFVHRDPRKVRGIITNPESGITYDLIGDYEVCPSTGTVYESNWNFRLVLHWDVWYLPANVYAPADDLFSVNGIFEVEATAS